MADSRIVLIANTWHYNSTLMQLISRQYHALPTHCHPCSVSQCHWAGKRKFGELSPIGDTDAPIEFSHQFRQNRQNSTRQNPTLGWKITTRPEWVGNFLHARGFECGTRALYYHHWNSIEMQLVEWSLTPHQQQIECIHSQDPKRQHDWKWYTRARANTKETANFRFLWAPQTLWAPREIHYI